MWLCGRGWRLGGRGDGEDRRTRNYTDASGTDWWVYKEARVHAEPFSSNVPKVEENETGACETLIRSAGWHHGEWSNVRFVE